MNASGLALMLFVFSYMSRCGPKHRNLSSDGSKGVASEDIRNTGVEALRGKYNKIMADIVPLRRKLCEFRGFIRPIVKQEIKLGYEELMSALDRAEDLLDPTQDMQLVVDMLESDIKASDERISQDFVEKVEYLAAFLKEGVELVETSITSLNKKLDTAPRQFNTIFHGLCDLGNRVFKIKCEIQNCTDANNVDMLMLMLEELSQLRSDLDIYLRSISDNDRSIHVKKLVDEVDILAKKPGDRLQLLRWISNLGRIYAKAENITSETPMDQVVHILATVDYCRSVMEKKMNQIRERSEGELLKILSGHMDIINAWHNSLISRLESNRSENSDASSDVLVIDH